jgi:DNA repair protein RadC
MPRGRREQHPLYQLPLALELDRARHAAIAQYRAAVLDLAKQDEQPGRFVRALHERITIHSPSDAAHHLQTQIFHPFSQFEQEEFWVLLLNTKNHLTHETMVYRGTVNKMYVRVAEVFREAIRLNAVSLILSHCHPSGEPTPSPEDVRMTELVVEAGKLLDISILDHVVVGAKHWVSMKERQLGFKG